MVMHNLLWPFAAVVFSLACGATDTGRTSTPPPDSSPAPMEYATFAAQREDALLDVSLICNRTIVFSDDAHISLESALTFENQPCQGKRSKLIFRIRQGALLVGRLTLTQETNGSTCVEVLATSPLVVIYPAALLYPLAGLALALGVWKWRKKEQRWKRISSGLCVKCPYPLNGLQDKRCPECGTPFGSEFQDPKSPDQRPVKQSHQKSESHEENQKTD